METYDAVKDFIDYITGDDNELPYGGLEKDAPQKAKDAYAEYLKKEKKNEKEGIVG